MTSTGLTLAPGLNLPLEAVTETFAILGKRGSGKTTTARVLTEELLDVGLPVVVMDPTGVWWGLRSSADGNHAGHQVVIFGGDHADVPLLETSGTVVADVIVDRRIPAVLDLSLLSKSAARRFAADLLERLYHRNRAPLHVVVDEADMFAPQRTPQGSERLLGAMNDLVRRGRVRGLGVTLITQRPAVLNKDVLTQAEVLVAMRLIGARDRAAISEWIEAQASVEAAREVISSLPGLPVGTAWVWSPGWLDILQRVEIRTPHTFDSSATPKPGQRVVAPKRMAVVDLAALSEQITATIEQAKADDPKALRRRVADLEHQLAAARRQTPASPVRRPEPITVEVPVNVPVLGAEQVAEMRRMADAASEWARKAIDAAGSLTAAVDAAAHAAAAHEPVAASRAERAPALARVTAPPRPPRPTQAGDEANLARAERAILTVLAQHGTRSTTQVAILTGYSHKSGGYRNALSKLRSAGYIDGRGDVTATSVGVAALGEYDPLPTGAELRRWWSENQLGKAERAILDVLSERYPDTVDVAEIADATGYSPTSGGFRNALSRLRSLELAAGRGSLTMSDTLASDPGASA